MDTPDRGSVVPEDLSTPQPVRLVCRGCGYDLKGLAPDGVCPECGMAIARSLAASDLLEYSSPEYVATLHKGTFIVLAAIIAMILCTFGMVGGAILGTAAGMGTGGIETLFKLLLTLCAFASAYGWWLLSSPDPASREGQRGEKARKVVRICTLIGAGLGVAGFVLGLFVTATSFTFPGGAPPGGAQPGTGASAAAGLASIFGLLLALINSIAGVIAFFAQMLYVRWLAPRLPNEWVFRRAKLLLWLGPLLYTVGSLCLGLGPLVALVLYWNMLDRVRKDLKATRERMAVRTVWASTAPSPRPAIAAGGPPGPAL